MNIETPVHLPEINQNLPARAINQVVFYGDNGFLEAATVLLLQPEKTRTFEFLFHPTEPIKEVKEALEFWIEQRLPAKPPENYVLLAIRSNAEPIDLRARKLGDLSYQFVFVEEGAFEFREKSPEDFRPRQLEIKVLANGLRFYADSSYLIWNKENEVPVWVEEIEAKIVLVQRFKKLLETEEAKPFLTEGERFDLAEGFAFLTRIEKRFEAEFEQKGKQNES